MGTDAERRAALSERGNEFLFNQLRQVVDEAPELAVAPCTATGCPHNSGSRSQTHQARGTTLSTRRLHPFSRSSHAAAQRSLTQTQTQTQTQARCRTSSLSLSMRPLLNVADQDLVLTCFAFTRSERLLTTH